MRVFVVATVSIIGPKYWKSHFASSISWFASSDPVLRRLVRIASLIAVLRFESVKMRLDKATND